MRSFTSQTTRKDIGPISRLVGFKWIRRDEHLEILKLPCWVPGSVTRKVAENLQAHYRFTRPDAKPTLTSHRNLIRIEWCGSNPDRREE